MVQRAGQCFTKAWLLEQVFTGTLDSQVGSCSQLESWLVFSVLVAEQEALGKGCCVPLSWQHS